MSCRKWVCGNVAAIEPTARLDELLLERGGELDGDTLAGGPLDRKHDL